MIAGEVREAPIGYDACGDGMAITGSWLDLDTCRADTRGVWHTSSHTLHIWDCDGWTLTYLRYLGWTLHCPLVSAVLYPEDIWGPRTDGALTEVLRIADWIKNHGWPGGHEAWDTKRRGSHGTGARRGR